MLRDHGVFGRAQRPHTVRSGDVDGTAIRAAEQRPVVGDEQRTLRAGTCETIMVQGRTDDEIDAVRIRSACGRSRRCVQRALRVEGVVRVVVRLEMIRGADRSRARVRDRYVGGQETVLDLLPAVHREYRRRTAHVQDAPRAHDAAAQSAARTEPYAVDFADQRRSAADDGLQCERRHDDRRAHAALEQGRPEEVPARRDLAVGRGIVSGASVAAQDQEVAARAPDALHDRDGGAFERGTASRGRKRETPARGAGPRVDGPHAAVRGDVRDLRAGVGRRAAGPSAPQLLTVARCEAADATARGECDDPRPVCEHVGIVRRPLDDVRPQRRADHVRGARRRPPDLGEAVGSLPAPQCACGKHNQRGCCAENEGRRT
jgi:hypothetical protein